MDNPRPPLRGKYSIRNPVWNRAFQAADFFLELMRRAGLLGKVRDARTSAPPRRILISDIAHLGDVLMATSVLPLLKSAYPEARIGFLVGSWAQAVLQEHPLVDDVHILDHWAHNRSAEPRRVKIAHYLRTRRLALRQIRAAGYDAAFDFYWNFPNTLPLLWQAGIPMRVGYESGGFGPLATHCLEFGDKRLHAAQRFLDLVKTLPEVEAVLQRASVPLRSCLPPLKEADSVQEEYIVFHVGAADAFRDWPEPQWRELARMFAAQGHSLVFTGAGEKDEARIQAILGDGGEDLRGCVNLCGRLSWSGFVAAIAGARLLVCVDTVAGHLAAATQTPCVVITAGRWPYLWRPLGPDVRVVMHPVPCAPCHRNSGCAGMECVREVSVASVYEQSQILLNFMPSPAAGGSVK